MDNIVSIVSEVMLSLAKNIHLEFSLSGWPAAVSVVAICGAGVAIYGLSVNRHDSSGQSDAEHR